MNSSLRRSLGRACLGACLLVVSAPAQRARAADPVSATEAERLGPRAADVQRVIDRAARAGLPTEGLGSKVHEGLAKGASPEAILRAVEHQAQALGDANTLVRQQRKAPASTALVRAVAEVLAAGVASEVVRPVVAAAADDGRVARALEVLTDLATRGYPERGTGLLVRDVLERDPGSLGHIAGGLESIRRGQTVSRADALELLGRNLLASGNSLDVAVNRSLEGREHGGGVGNDKNNGHGNDHGASASNKKGQGMGQGNMK